MNWTARGLPRPDGREPALKASTRSPPCRRANASAIWLRQEFSTHTKSTRLAPPSASSGPAIVIPSSHTDGAAVVRRGRLRPLPAAFTAVAAPVEGVAPGTPEEGQGQ